MNFGDNKVEGQCYEIEILTQSDVPDYLVLDVYNTNSVKMSWGKVKHVTGYYVYYKKYNSKDYTYLGKTKSTSYSKGNLALNTEYLFMVTPYALVDGEEIVANNSIYSSAKIGKLNISKLAKVSGVYNKTYTGKARTLNIKVTYNGKNVPVKVTYKNNKNIGKAYVTIRATGDYTGTITKSFNIVPSKNKITSLKSRYKRSATIKYSSVKGGVRYQIAYKKNGSKTWKYTYYSGKTKTIKGLKSKKKYTFKVRAYKKVKGTNIYGSWSNTKKITIK